MRKSDKRWARLALATLAWLAATPATVAADLSYDVLFDARIVPTEGAIRVDVQVGRGAQHLRQVTWSIDPDRHFGFEGDGTIEISETTVSWSPPPEGGSFRYTFHIDHLRDERTYDARSTRTWALFRGDDLVPPARTRVTVGAKSRSTLQLKVPDGWSRATPYPLLRGGVYRVSHPERGFDRPTGWIVAGQLGALREEVEGVQVAIAGPVNHGFRRLDVLAMIRWTFPTLRKILGDLPPRLLVVGAGDPMWRGGLSGPHSVYVHARRPLMSEDGSSPLLHEIMHAMLGVRGGPMDDWIVEGLAEFYSLELLERSGTVSANRMEAIYDRMKKRGRKAADLKSNRASGDRVAKAVVILHELDTQIRSRSKEQHSLDDVVRLVAQETAPITRARLIELTTQATGLEWAAFFKRYE